MSRHWYADLMPIAWESGNCWMGGRHEQFLKHLTDAVMSPIQRGSSEIKIQSSHISASLRRYYGFSWVRQVSIACMVCREASLPPALSQIALDPEPDQRSKLGSPLLLKSKDPSQPCQEAA